MAVCSGFLGLILFRAAHKAQDGIGMALGIIIAELAYLIGKG